MRADVVDGMEASVYLEDSDQPAIDLGDTTAAFGQVGDPANGAKIGHPASENPWTPTGHADIILPVLRGPPRRVTNETHMVEVEVKYPVSSFEGFEQWLADQGAVGPNRIREEDHYFQPPDRDFSASDEALRLRTTASANVLTYKGPKRDQQTKTRTEVEVPLAPGEGPANACRQLLMRLRYQPVANVLKTRRRYEVVRENFTLSVCLDEVDTVGRFMELEILTPEEQVNAARQVLVRAAAALGLGASERRSYLELLLTEKAKVVP